MSKKILLRVPTEQERSLVCEQMMLPGFVLMCLGILPTMIGVGISHGLLAGISLGVSVFGAGYMVVAYFTIRSIVIPKTRTEVTVLDVDLKA